jgi:hypothetical protein
MATYDQRTRIPSTMYHPTVATLAEAVSATQRRAVVQVNWFFNQAVSAKEQLVASTPIGPADPVTGALVRSIAAAVVVLITNRQIDWKSHMF